MDSKDVLIEAYGRLPRLLEMSLQGLTAEQLAYRPTEQANSIAWLAWHLTRIQDHHISALASRPQAWIEEGWHARFGRPADPEDHGGRHTAEQVAALRPDGPQILLDYFNAVHPRSLAYLQQVTPAELDRVLNEPRYNPMPTVGVRLISVIGDNVQHAGQIAYLRGCLEARHWFPA